MLVPEIMKKLNAREKNEKIFKEFIKSDEYKDIDSNIIMKYHNGATPNSQHINDLIEKYGSESIKSYCVYNSIYCVPTTELIDFIKNEIKNYNKKDVIEIASGNGYLCDLLNIKGTDSKCQLEGKVREAIYESGQYPIQYQNKDVIKTSANDAVKRLKPKVIIASWATDKYDPNNHDKGGFIHGVEDWKFFNTSSVEKYIFIGNMGIHKNKYIFDKERVEKEAKCKIKYRTYIGGCSRKFDEENIIVVIERDNE